MQQDCCSLVVSQYTYSRLYIWMCTRITRTYQSCCRFLFVSYVQIQGWLRLKRNMREKKINIYIYTYIYVYTRIYIWMKKYAAITAVYPKGQSQNASLKQDQRYTTTQREHARVSVLCRQTSYYGSKRQEKVHINL